MNELLVFRGIERIVIAATIPLLLWIGYKLFVLGATGQMTVTAKANTTQAKITNLSPGCFCFLIAVCLAGYTLSRGAQYDLKTKSSPDENSAAATPTPATSPTPKTDSAPNSSIKKGSQSPNMPKGVSELEWRYAGGRADKIPTSIVIRMALSNFALCRMWTNDPDNCKKELDTKLKRIPTSEELAAIEKLEQNPVTAADQARLRSDRQDYVWENKK